ncbi:MAG TPA: hypothetical protein VGB77_09430 [Abditibacteriaceae bacterium]
MNFKELLQAANLDWSKAHIELDCGTALNVDLGEQMYPKDFLNFAEEDLKGGDERAFVNSLKNSKRSMDSQVDYVFKCLHLNPKRTAQYLKDLNILTRERGINAQLTLLQELGVVAPRIIRKFRQYRNILEHEYRCPTQEQAEDALDIATLFIEASERSLRSSQESWIVGNFSAEVEAELSDDEPVLWWYDTKFENSIYFTFSSYRQKEPGCTARLWGNLHSKSEDTEVLVTTDMAEYSWLLKLSITIEKENEKGMKDVLAKFEELSKS